MSEEGMIAASEFCVSHNVEISFVEALHESGLLETTVIEETTFINADQLPELEKLVRFHYDMDINLQGIEAIHHLLQQMKAMQEEMRSIKRRLSLYERVDG